MLSSRRRPLVTNLTSTLDICCCLHYRKQRNGNQAEQISFPPRCLPLSASVSLYTPSLARFRLARCQVTGLPVIARLDLAKADNCHLNSLIFATGIGGQFAASVASATVACFSVCLGRERFVVVVAVACVRSVDTAVSSRRHKQARYLASPFNRPPS